MPERFGRELWAPEPMTMLQLSRTGADTLLRIVGFPFWLMRACGLISLSLDALQWAAAIAPLNPRQCAFDAALTVLGWSGVRLCALARARLNGSNNAAALSARSAA